MLMELKFSTLGESGINKPTLHRSLSAEKEKFHSEG